MASRLSGAGTAGGTSPSTPSGGLAGGSQSAGFEGSASNIEELIHRNIAQLLGEQIFDLGRLVKFLNQFFEVIDMDLGSIDKNAVGAGIGFDDHRFSIGHDPGRGAAAR